MLKIKLIRLRFLSKAVIMKTVKDYFGILKESKMATYVMSDIHGEYEKFDRMLELINFTDNDLLYILGDVLDRGPEPIKLLRDLSFRSNVFCLLGNHEVMAIDVLQTLLVEINEENCETQIDALAMNKLMEYQANGGDITLKQLRELPNDERLDLLDFLKDFELYDVVDVGDKTFILSHTGNINPNKKLSEHSVEELTFSRSNYEGKVFEEASIYLLCGHTPTQAITGEAKIYYKNNYINLDCGATFGGKLACLRLDDFKEFYL